jgi:site-specific recombinase XerD
MDKRYNFYNFEASFKKFLLAENVSPITLKNYLSDLRHFLGWLMFYWKSHFSNTAFLIDQNLIEILKQVHDDTIEKYKSYLIANNLPLKTINRRLSTLRKFFSFCISQGWLKENPAKKIQNLKLKIDSIISSFALSLEKENLDQKTIKSYLEVIQEFLRL